MNTLNRSKSPHSTSTIRATEKEESFWDKFSTLGRKKGSREGNLSVNFIVNKEIVK